MNCDERFALLRSAIAGPKTLKEWADEAGIHHTTLSQGYSCRRSAEVLGRLAVGAAKLLGLDKRLVADWLRGAEEVPDLVLFLERVARERECNRCKRWVDRADFDSNQGCCCACQRQRQRSEKGAKFIELLAAKLPEIRAVRPELGEAVEEALRDPSRAPTNERLARLTGSRISSREVSNLLKRLGVDKRTIAQWLIALSVAGGATQLNHTEQEGRRHKCACATNRRRPQRRRRGGAQDLPQSSARPIAPIASMAAALGAAS